MTHPARPTVEEVGDAAALRCDHALATENNGRMYDWTTIVVACRPCIVEAARPLADYVDATEQENERLRKALERLERDHGRDEKGSILVSISSEVGYDAKAMLYNRLVRVGEIAREALAPKETL